jgi:integrase
VPTTADFQKKGSSVATARATRLVLTDRHLRALKPAAHAQDFHDMQQRGLIARILPSGIIQFSVRYRFQGKQKRLKLGAYPAVSLQEARKRARNAQASIDEGHDPAGERHAAKAPRTDTIEALAADYLKKHARKHKRSAHEDERILDVDVLPHWREISVRDLTRRDVRTLIDRVADRAPIMANRVLALVRKMLNFAVDQDWIDANPAARVQKPAREVSRDRVLTDEELRRLWRVLSNLPSTADRPAPGRARAKGSQDDPLCPISAPLAALLKVRLLTAQRGGEVTRMRWVDLDLESGWWTIPATDTKNGEPHRVPLSDDVVALIRAQQKDARDRDYVFVGQGASLRDRAKKAPSAIARVLGIEFRGHDLRRTAATRIAEAGIPRDHIAKVLNHVEGGPRATRVYDRHTYDREKRLAIDTWTRTLKSIVENTDPGKVLPLARRPGKASA